MLIKLCKCTVFCRLLLYSAVTFAICAACVGRVSLITASSRRVCATSPAMGGKLLLRKALDWSMALSTVCKMVSNSLWLN